MRDRPTKSMALIAASALALTAGLSAAAQDAVVLEPEAQEAQTPEADDKGMLETLFSDEQPPLEGDSPLVSDEDVAESVVGEDEPLVGEPYADEPVLADDAEAPMIADEPALAQDAPAQDAPDR